MSARLYTANILNSGAPPWQQLCAAVLARAVLDARGELTEFPVHGPKERPANYAQRKELCTEDAQRFLSDDAYTWCEFMERPHVWHDILDGLAP